MRAAIHTIIQTALIVGLMVGAGSIAARFFRPVRVVGGSMQPALSPGDLAIVAIDSRLEPGHIALLRTERHGMVLHRVVEKLPNGSVRTRGDANSVADFDTRDPSEVVGPVVMVAPVGKLIQRWRGGGSCATMTAQ